MELGLLFWPQTPGLISWGPQVQVLPGALPRSARKLRPPVRWEAPRLAFARRERFQVLPGAPTFARAC
jgi:hypothetical protein